MKRAYGKELVVAQIVCILTALLGVFVLRVVDREFWTQVWMVAGIALFSGLAMILIIQLIGKDKPKK